MSQRIVPAERGILEQRRNHAHFKIRSCFRLLFVQLQHAIIRMLVFFVDQVIGIEVGEGMVTFRVNGKVIGGKSWLVSRWPVQLGVLMGFKGDKVTLLREMTRSGSE
jgi:hypothetical protein